MKYPEKPSIGEYTEKKSRFIGYLFPLTSEEEAEEILLKIRKKHYDARHHSYAYVLGDRNEISKQSDDGEPSRTAGFPILNVLVSEDIHDSILIVVRYFGGTLLGTGGLVRSYTEAAKKAVENASLKESIDGFRANIEIPYHLFGQVKNMLKGLDIRLEREEFAENVTLSALVSVEKREDFQKKLRDILSSKQELEFEPCRWYNP